jgi:hypothetical protein
VQLRGWAAIPIVAPVLAACDTGSPNDERPPAASGEPPGDAPLSVRRSEVRFATSDGVLLRGSRAGGRRWSC